MATSLIYVNPETTLWFVPATATQAEDAAFEVASLGAAAGRQSAQHDLGVSAHAREYEWCWFCKFATAPVVGEGIRLYLKTSGTSASATAHPLNDDGTGEGAVSALDKTNNLIYLGTMIVDEAVTTAEMVARGTVFIDARAIQVVAWNATADALSSGVNDSGFFLTPVPSEGQ